MPSVVCGDEVWRGLSYISGSWIGGGANAVAMVGCVENDFSLSWLASERDGDGFSLF